MAAAGLRRIAKVRPSDVATIARAARWIVRTKAILRRGGFPALVAALDLRVLEPETARDPDFAAPAQAERAVRVAWRVTDLASLSVTCLPRAVVMCKTLEAHGLAPELVIGVRDDDGFKAHAWAEVAGRTVGWNEQGARTWRIIGRFAPAGAR